MDTWRDSTTHGKFHLWTLAETVKLMENFPYGHLQTVQLMEKLTYVYCTDITTHRHVHCIDSTTHINLTYVHCTDITTL